MSEPIGQHTNPKMSLKRFREKGVPLHHIHDGKIEDISIKRASVRDNFYTVTELFPEDQYKYENNFQKIESKTSTIFDKLQGDGTPQLSEKELGIIREFIAWQFLRTVAMREEMETLFYSKLSELAETHLARSDVEKSDPIISEIARNARETVWVKSELYTYQMGQSFDSVYAALCLKRIELLHLKKQFLITSDNPVILLNSGSTSVTKGISLPNTILAYPMSRNRLIVLIDGNDGYLNLESDEMGLNFVDFVNIGLYAFSKNVYCHPNDSAPLVELLESFMAAKYDKTINELAND